MTSAKKIKSAPDLDLLLISCDEDDGELATISVNGTECQFELVEQINREERRSDIGDAYITSLYRCVEIPDVLIARYGYYSPECGDLWGVDTDSFYQVKAVQKVITAYEPV